jgi:hypothetical protein
MGRGQCVGQGDLDEIDYWWRYVAENPMVMGLLSWQILVVGSGVRVMGG